MLSQQELEYLASLAGPTPSSPVGIEQPIPESNSSNLLARTGQHLVNLPSNAANALISDFLGLAQSQLPFPFYPEEGVTPIPQVTEVAPAQTTGEGVIDFLGGGLAPEIASFLVPYSGVGKLAKGSKLAQSPALLESVKQGLAGGFSGSSEGTDIANIAMLGGAAGGLMEKFNRIKRLLPAATASGLEYALMDQSTDAGTKEKLLQSAVTFVGNMIPGAIRPEIPKVDLPFGIEDKQQQLRLTYPRPEDIINVPPQRPTPLALPEFIPSRPVPVPQSTIIPPPRDAEEAARRILELNPMAASAYESAQNIRFPIERGGQGELINLNEYPITREGVLLNDKQQQIAPNLQRTLDELFPQLRPINPQQQPLALPPVASEYRSPIWPRKVEPEQALAPFMRSLRPKAVANPIEQIVNPQSQPTPEFDFTRPAPWTELQTRKAPTDPEVYRPAFQTPERLVSGKRGETHNDIMNREADVLMAEADNKAVRGFIDDEGNFYSRKEVGDALGYKGEQFHSQELQRLTENKKNPEAKPEIPNLSGVAAMAEGLADNLSPADLRIIRKLTAKGKDRTGIRNYLASQIDEAEFEGDLNRVSAYRSLLNESDTSSPVEISAEVDKISEVTETLMDRLEAVGEDPAKRAAKLEDIAKKRGFKLKGKTEDERLFSLASRMSGVGGQAQQEMLSSMAGALAGGATGYAESDGDLGVALSSALVGAGLGLGAVRAVAKLRKTTGSTDAKAKAAAQISKANPEETLTQKFTRLAEQTSSDLASRAVTGRGGVLANTIHIAENMLGLNMPWAVKSAKMLSGGLVSDIVEKLNVVLDQTKSIKATPDFIQSASKYLKGQLISREQTLQIVKQGGGIESLEFEKLPFKEQQALQKILTEKWIVRDPSNTNTKGEGIKVYKVTKETQTRLANANREALQRAAGSNADNMSFMELPLQARQSINQMMSLIHDALPANSRAAKKILGTMDQYQTRTFDIFTDSSYYPTEEKILARMDEVENWLVQNKLSELNSKGQVSIESKSGWITLPDGRFVSPDGQRQLDLFSNKDFLRKEVEEELWDYKRNSATYRTDSKSNDLDTSLFTGRKELTPALRALMGEHENVVDEVIHTLNRIMPSAEAGAFISSVLEKTMPSGLKPAYKSPEEYITKLNEVQNKLNLTSSPVEQANLQTQLNNLKAYRKVGKDARMGLMEGSYVDRFVYHELKEFRSPFGLLENPIGRGMAAFNNEIKKSKTVRNPITHVRNAITVPFFLAMGGAAKSPTAWKTAAAILKDKNHPLRTKINQLGILDATQTRGEFNINTRELLSGEYDSKIYQKLKKADNFAAELYNIPDAFVRVSAFLAAEERAARKLGVSIVDNDPRVIDEAMQFVQRRTMDYRNMPDAVKVARQLPFVNMFISYAHEIARISKNMAIDAAKGDIQAGMTLAGMVTLPSILQASFESDLSSEDRKEWEMAQRMSPAYSRTRFKLPTGKDSKGNQHYLDFTTLIPHDAYLQMARAVTSGDSEAFMASNPWISWDNTPALSIISEQIAGRDLRTRRDFQGSWDRLDSILEEILPPETPGFGYEWGKMVQAFSPTESGELGVTNYKTGRRETIEGWLVRHATGINPSSVNTAILQKNTLARYKRIIANERAYLNDVLKSDVTNQVKQRAINTFKEASMIHAEEFRKLFEDTTQSS